MKKIICVFFICTALLFTPANAQDRELVPIDAVLIIDVSWSMAEADPNRIANEATNMFIDMLDAESDRVGIVAYAGTVTMYRELMFLTGENTAYLHSLIDGLRYASWTDHPLGLLEAIRILSNAHTPDRQPIIIFLTDGNLSLNPNGRRTVPEAEADKALAIELAQYYGFPIYSIGLNYDGTLDRRYIEVVADATGGLAFETYNAEDLPDIMAAIFAEMISIPPPNTGVSLGILPEVLPAEVLPEIETVIEKDKYIQEPAGINRLLFFLLAIAIPILILVLSIFLKPKRVFTGKLAIEMDGKMPIYKNLVEYGNRAALQKLLPSSIGVAAFAGITLAPSPTAPSHLPQLLLKCKNPHLKFKKNFLEQESSKEISINSGTEVTITNEKEQITLRIKYLV